MARKKLRTRPHHWKLNNRFLLIGVIFLISFIIILKSSHTNLSKKSNQDITNKTALTGLHVPGLNDEVSEEGLAVPRSVVENSPGSRMKIRSFEIFAKNNSFSVNKIIVNQNDVIRIQLTAFDKTYDLTLPALGISQTVEKGESKTLEFQAIADGTFVFSCQSCDGPSESLKGILYVKPAQKIHWSY